MYIAAPTLSFADSIPGAGIYSGYHQDLRLTSPNEHRPSFWTLPAFFARTQMTYHDLTQWKRTGDKITGKSAGRGQEFVIKTDDVQPEARNWLASIFRHAERIHNP